MTAFLVTALLTTAAMVGIVPSASAAAVPGGPVIIDGNDPADHTYGITAYIQDVYASLDSNIATGYSHDGTVAVIGTCGSMLEGMVSGKTFVAHDTAAEVQTLFSDIGANNHAHLHICSDGDRTLSSAVENELDLWGSAIAQHVNRGGGLFATGHSFNWLRDLFPSLGVTGGGTSASYVTSDGASFFPSLALNARVDAINHNTFDNVGTTTLLPLLSEYQNGGGRIVAAGGTTVRFPQVSITGPSTAVVGATESFTLVAKDADGNTLSNNDFTYSIDGPTNSAVTDANGTTDANGEYQFSFTATSTGTTKLSVQLSLSSGAAAGTSLSTDWITIPSAPLDLAAADISGEDDSIVVSWNAPADDGGTSLTDYVVQHSEDGTTWTTFADGTSTTRSVAITGLTNATDYDFRVAAVNTVGQGAWSGVATATPAGSPGIPDLHTTAPADGEVALAWDQPTLDNGAEVTHYVVESTPTGDAAWTGAGTNPTGTTTTVTGLDNGTSYDFRVAAVNSNGTGAWSEVLAAVPFTTPDAVRELSVTEADGQLDVLWTEPAFDGGRDVTDHTVVLGSGASCSPEHVHPAGTTGHWYGCTFDGLENGTVHDVTVAAVNAAGEGAPTTVSGSPYGAPLAPVVSADDGDGRSEITWTAADGNGRDVTGYQVYVDGVPAGTTDADNRSVTLDALTNGDTVTVAVVASNAAGPGAPGTARATPFTVPDAPTPAISEGDGQITVTWDTPAGNGRHVSAYRVLVDGEVHAVLDGDTTALVIGELVNGRAVTVTVHASNLAGEGPGGTASGVPSTAPGPVQDLDVSMGDGTMTISWAPPADDGGHPVANYTVAYRVLGSDEWTTIEVGDATRTTIEGIADDLNYEVRVLAAGLGGTSTPATIDEVANPAPLPATGGRLTAPLTTALALLGVGVTLLRRTRRRST